ncbi:sororin [Amia ocellicauda]|uniref:sororin n=1 Tax=Amia ocellicauda TaxID=2972642 RepID=UPI0034645500
MTDMAERRVSAGLRHAIQDDREPRSSGTRRSGRLSNPQMKTSATPVPPAGVKRSITVRKIVPRKTQVPDPPPALRRSPRAALSPSDADKENVKRVSAGKEHARKARPTTPSSTHRRRPSQSQPPKPQLLSPILAPIQPPPPETSPPPAQADPRDLQWSQKVRRSYSRVSDPSFEGSFLGSPGRPPLADPEPPPTSSSSPSRRSSLFGFRGLLSPEGRRCPPAAIAALSSSSSPKLHRQAGESSWASAGSVTLLGHSSAAAPSFSLPSPEQDHHIPGVALVKKTKRRKKVQQIKLSELDHLAAQMNAEFEEAENFDLVVE